MKETAEERVLGISGVLDVANELQIDHVSHAAPTDQEVVTLFGSVSGWQDALEVEEAVSDVHGVEEVVDELIVRGQTSLDIDRRARG